MRPEGGGRTEGGREYSGRKKNLACISVRTSMLIGYESSVAAREKALLNSPDSMVSSRYNVRVEYGIFCLLLPEKVKQRGGDYINIINP